MLSALFKLFLILGVAGAAGFLGQVFFDDSIAWLFALSVLAFSLWISYMNQVRLDVFVKGAGVSQLSGFGGAWAEIFF